MFIKSSWKRSELLGIWITSFPLNAPFFEWYFKFLPWLTVIGREPAPKNFGEKISIFLGASPPQTLDTKRGAADA